MVAAFVIALAFASVDGEPALSETAPVAADAPFSLSAVGAEQAVVVVTESWSATLGTLKRYEKVGKQWQQVGLPIEVVVGENGLGWGLGLHPLGVGEPRKLEGDERSPAGVFALTSAFGRGSPAVKTKMPWLAATPKLECVNDPRSARYNRIVDGAADSPVDAGSDDASADAGARSTTKSLVPVGSSAYNTAEPLLREDGLFDVALLVDHNGAGDVKKSVIPGRGSCVFMHVWKRKGRPTSGGTAMARLDLDKILEWLEPARHPVLVQLPKEEFVKRRGPWGLP